MKLKFKLMTVFAALGVASSGFAAWNFATATSGEVNIAVGIEGVVGSIGTIDFDEIGTYNLADTPNPLVFKAKFNPSLGINLSEVDLTYKVTLNSALADLIDFGSASEGVWVSDVATSITPTWNAGKNPTSAAAYNAIKANLANLSMNVTLSAKMKDGSEPVAPAAIVPGVLPAGLVEGPGGLLEFDKDLGPVQLVVQGIDEHGNPDGVAQNFNWTSSDPTRASVVDGLVTPLDNGNVTITATAQAIAPISPLKRSDGGAASYDFHFNIVGFEVVPPDPVPTTIELVLGEGVTNKMVLEIGQEISVSARVLDENNNVMPELVIDHELFDDESVTYIDGVLKAIAAVEDSYIEFTYEELSVTFFFSVNPAPVIEPSYILINGGVALEVPFAQGSGTLTAVVYDADNNVMEGETVTWSVPNNSVISINAETGAYTINGAGVVVVTAKSVTNEYVMANLQLTVLEPPVVYHTVTFNYDDGVTPNSSQQVEDNDSVAKPVDPTREGYSFVNWTKDGEEYDFGDAVTSNIILKATWTKNTYTVVFDTDGGAPVPADRNIKHGELVEEPDNPTKEGYSFGGWYLGEAVYQWDTPVTSSFTLKAHWNVIQYTVTFDTGDGTSVPTQTIDHGDKVVKPADPVEAGSDFVRWELNGAPYDFDAPVTEDLVLVAVWKPASGEEDSFYLNIDFAALNHSKPTTALSNNGEILTILQNAEQKDSGDPSQILSASISGNVYPGNGQGGGSSENVKGLIKFGTGSLAGSITFKVSNSVHTVNVLAAGWSATETGVQVNGEVKQAPYHVSDTSLGRAWLEYPLEPETDTITIGTVSKRALIFGIELIGGPVVPLADLASVAISSASGASVQEKQNLQLSALVKDVDGATVDNATLAWESLNADVATVNNNGLVSALVPGTAMIKVTATRMESLVVDQFAVTVTARPAGFPNKVVLVGYESAQNPALSIALATGTTSLTAKVFNQYNEEMTGVELVWESSNPTVATVSNGVVTLLDEGTTTIKVSVDGDAFVYAELVLTVGSTQETKTATLSYSGSSTTNMGSGNNAASVGLDQSVFNVTSDKGEGNNEVGLNKDGTLRLYYKDTSAGVILSVSIASGMKITGIKFNFGGTVAQAKILLGGVEAYNDTPTKNGSLSFDDLEVEGFSIQNVNTSNSQLYIKSIVITYVS